MLKKILLMLVLCILVSGCSFNKQENEIIIDTETEVIVPDTTDDIYQEISSDEITIQVQVSGSMKFAPKFGDEGYSIVYENAKSFNYAIVEVKYMPNYKLFESYAINSEFRELQHGYVAIVTSYGLSNLDCSKLLQAVQIVSFTGE